MESDAINQAGLDHNTKLQDLFVVPFSQEYSAHLSKAAELLRKASELTDSSR